MSAGGRLGRRARNLGRSSFLWSILRAAGCRRLLGRRHGGDAAQGARDGVAARALGRAPLRGNGRGVVASGGRIGIRGAGRTRSSAASPGAGSAGSFMSRHVCFSRGTSLFGWTFRRGRRPFGGRGLILAMFLLLIELGFLNR